MPLNFHEIAEVDHRILNPITEDKLLLVGEVARIPQRARLLDLACGKGELLCRFAQRYDAAGVGVDLSEVFLAAARHRAAELRVDDRLEFVQADAGAYTAEGSYDVVSCVGATWIGGGLAGTIDLMRPALREGGTLLIGEPYWNEPPPPEACAAIGVPDALFASLVGTLDRFAAADLDLVEMVLADGDSWDRYAAAKWAATRRWLDAHPDDPDAAQVRAYLDDDRRAYLAYERRYLGWGVFVLRAR